MALVESGFLPRDTQKLALTRNLGDALMVVATALWPHNTAKHAEEEWGIDRSSGKNVVKGVAGGVIITRAVHAEQSKRRAGWRLWLALGELIIGEPLEAYEKREVARILKEAQDASRRQAERSERRATVAEVTATLVALHDRARPQLSRRGAGRAGIAADEVVRGPAGGEARAEVGETTRAFANPSEKGRVR